VHNYDANTDVGSARQQREFSLLATFKKVFRMIAQALADDQFALLFEDDIAVHTLFGAQVGRRPPQGALAVSLSDNIYIYINLYIYSSCRRSACTAPRVIFKESAPSRISSRRWPTARAWRKRTASCTWAAAGPPATTPRRTSTTASRS